MAVKVLLIIGAVMTLLLTYTHAVPGRERFIYTEETGDSRNTYSWELHDVGNGVEIEAAQEGKKFVNACDDRGITREWIVMDTEQSFRVVREGDSLVFSGYRFRQQLQKRVQIDDAPWFQPLSYSLRRFLELPEQSVTFWHIRSDTLEPVKLVAEKEGLSTDPVCGGRAGFLITIRPSGILSPFWHASYWFRAEDHVFCCYEGRHGGLGTPMTVICLQEPD